MDEKVLISSISTVLVKNLLCSKFHYKNNQYISNSKTIQKVFKYPLLEPNNDVDDNFIRLRFLHSQTRLENERKRNRREKTKALHQKRKDLSQHPSSKCSNTEMNLLNTLDHHNFENQLHMTKRTFLKVFQSVHHLLQQQNLFPLSLSPQSSFSLALWKLTTNQHFEVIANKFRIPLKECHRNILEFSNIISNNYETFIHWPNTEQQQQLNLQAFRELPSFRFLKNTFGIIASKPLEVVLENQDSETTIILQIVCNADKKIIDCFAEMSEHYSFDRSPIGRTLSLNEHTLPKRCFLIGDKSFPLRPYLIRPFQIESNHRETVFNRILETALVKAHIVLDEMVKRFNALNALEAIDLQQVRRILETICALHNMCTGFEDDYVERKCSVTKFNWSKKKLFISREKNEEGIRRRRDLLEAINI